LDRSTTRMNFSNVLAPLEKYQVYAPLINGTWYFSHWDLPNVKWTLYRDSNLNNPPGLIKLENDQHTLTFDPYFDNWIDRTSIVLDSTDGNWKIVLSAVDPSKNADGRTVIATVDLYKDGCLYGLYHVVGNKKVSHVVQDS